MYHEVFIKAANKSIRKTYHKEILKILLLASFTLRRSQSHHKTFDVARVRLGQLAVVHYNFVGHCFAFAAILTRE